MSADAEKMRDLIKRIRVAQDEGDRREFAAAMLDLDALVEKIKEQRK